VNRAGHRLNCYFATGVRPPHNKTDLFGGFLPPPDRDVAPAPDAASPAPRVSLKALDRRVGRKAQAQQEPRAQQPDVVAGVALHDHEIDRAEVFDTRGIKGDHDATVADVHGGGGLRGWLYVL
jgi:hypothetical protein